MGNIVINKKKPIKVFEEANVQQDSDMSGKAQPFEIDEIKKVVNDNDSKSTKEKTGERKSPVEIHDDEEDTARIGRSG